MMINHIMCTLKTLTNLCFTKQKIKTKNTFAGAICNALVVKNVLTEHKEDCLSINGKQSVKVEKGTIEFENYFKQIPVSFKIYADFECNLKGVQSYEGSYTKKYQDHIPYSFAYTVICVDDKFNKPIVVYRGDSAAYDINIGKK